MWQALVAVAALGTTNLKHVHRRNFLAAAAAATITAPAILTPATADQATLRTTFDVDPILAPQNLPPFTPPKNSLKGQTILITGANTGLGLESAKRLALAGARVVVTARSKSKVDLALDKVQEYCAQRGVSPSLLGTTLDLASLESVSTVATRLKSIAGSDLSIEVLMNNAGVMAIPERVETQDGFERTVGVNHLGHFALVSALLPMLKKAKGGFRIVNVSSDAHGFVNRKTMEQAIASNLDPAYTSGWTSYGISKAANVLFTLELSRRLNENGLSGSAVALHPGVVNTDLPRYVVGGVSAEDLRMSETSEAPTGLSKTLKSIFLDPIVVPVEKGASEQTWLAAAYDTMGDRTRSSKLYFGSPLEGIAFPRGEAFESGTSLELALDLWNLSEKLTNCKIDL